MSGAEETTREIMGNVPAWMAITFYIAVAMASFWAAFKFGRRLLQHRRGRKSSESAAEEKAPFLLRLSALGRYLIFHKKLLEDRFAGIAHVLLFYGFTVLFIGTCLVFLEHDTPLHFFYGRFYLVASLIIDLGGVAFLIGLSMFLYRRMFGRSQQILHRFYVAALLWLLLAIGVTGFLLEGARIAIDMPNFERWSVVGYSCAVLLNSIGISAERAETLHRFTWGFHGVVCIAFFALLPWQFFSHIVFSPLAWLKKTKRPLSTLRPVDLDALSANSHAAITVTSPGATEWHQLSTIDLLHADACTTCGRCNAVCPAHAADKPLRPRDIVLGIRDAMNAPTRPLGEFVIDDAIWSCTTCSACNQACPVGIEVYDKIVDVRRGIVEAGGAPNKAVEVFENLTDHDNPFQKPNEARLDWAAGLEVPVAADNEPIELLYWIGCAGSFESDGRSVSRAMVKILHQLNIPYRVLGKRERCSGDPARRLGEEGLFQELARSNIEILKGHGVSTILTHCPHCFNVFKNEYPQLADVSFKVQHHSQFLSDLIESGRLTISGELDKQLTFHDPCYLGRGNGETTKPRKVLAALPMVKNVEMPRNRCNSSCCGAGGGSLWLDVKGSDRIENQLAEEAAETGAEFVVTACPFCKTMLEAGRQSFDNQLSETMDLAEMVVKINGW